MPATWTGTADYPLDALTRFPGNARRGDVEAIAASLHRHGQYRGLVVRDAGAGQLVILAGNHTRDALELLYGGWLPPRADPASSWAGRPPVARCEVITCTDDEARRINLADNRTAELGTYDDEALASLLGYLDGDFEGTGWTADDLDALLAAGAGDGAGGDRGPRPSLSDRFLIPPFDVLDARQGWWRERKRDWLALGIRSELGRSSRAYQGQESLDDITGYDRGDRGLLLRSASGRDPSYYPQKIAAEARLGRQLTAAEFEAGHYDPGDGAGGVSSSGTSVFDPVLCELAYRWFCPPGGAVLDPFAGGSVRGLMAAMLGRTYRGNDLSADQVEANREQAGDFAARGLAARDAITWTAGDSAEWVATLEPGSADMILTCPPYYDLEAYGNGPADLSAMTTAAFDTAYAGILAGAARALRKDRFAVVVTGDARDKKGRLRDLRGVTVRAAGEAGLALVNGAVLITPAGSLPVRAGRSFEGTRTLGRCHQDVLVFCKGSRAAAAKACGPVEVDLSAAVLGSFDGAA